MISVKYKTLNITFENHTDLLENREGVNNLLLKLNSSFNQLKTRYKNGTIHKDSMTFTRLKNHQSLAVYIDVKSDKNPYLFIYNNKTKTLSNNVSYDTLKILNNEIVMGDLEDRIKHIDNPRYNAVIVPPLEKELKKMSKYLNENSNTKHIESKIEYE